MDTRNTSRKQAKTRAEYLVEAGDHEGEAETFVVVCFTGGPPPLSPQLIYSAS